LLEICRLSLGGLLERNHEAAQVSDPIAGGNILAHLFVERQQPDGIGL
jgi:hypothetical protein